jgi:sensor c-di-GMP phosphodiesterase-like protein
VLSHRAGAVILRPRTGTGYSSLSYLKKFPVDALKIDKSFVDGLGTEGDDSAIVRAIISLAGSLDLHTVAEGVETPTQLKALTDLGADKAQGYLFSRPQPPATLTKTLLAGFSDQPSHSSLAQRGKRARTADRLPSPLRGQPDRPH